MSGKKEIVYTERPTTKDASANAWDFAQATYGKPDKLIFNALCCGLQPFWIAEVKGTRHMIRPPALKRFTEDKEKITVRRGHASPLGK